MTRLVSGYITGEHTFSVHGTSLKKSGSTRLFQKTTEGFWNGYCEWRRWHHGLSLRSAIITKVANHMYDHEGVDAPAKIKLVPTATARRNDEQKKPPSQQVSVMVSMGKNIGASDEKSPVGRVFCENCQKVALLQHGLWNRFDSIRGLFYSWNYHICECK